MVSWLKSLDGVRRVNYSKDVAAGMTDFNKMLGGVSLSIILLLLAVAVFLISNTISVAAGMRKNENKIMRLIGATNFMIRAPLWWRERSWDSWEPPSPWEPWYSDTVRR